MTKTIIEKALAICLGGKVSRIAARVTTAPTQAPNACKVRAANKTYSLSVVAQISEAMTYRVIPK